MQMLNQEVAIGLYRKLGGKWLLHIDADEIFFIKSM